jgi:hypothetical protein
MNAAEPSVLPCSSSYAQPEDEVSDMGFLNAASLGYIGIQDHQLDLLRKCKSLRHYTQARQKARNSSRRVLPRAGKPWVRSGAKLLSSHEVPRSSLRPPHAYLQAKI